IRTWPKYRRRFRDGEQEKSTPSPFLREVPAELILNLGPKDEPGEVDLHGERYDVRQSARRNTYTGKTHNSLDSISQFFGDRGLPFKPLPPGVQAPRPAAQTPRSDPRTQPQLPKPNSGAPLTKPLPAAMPPRKGPRTGMTVQHPKYGTGTVVRREGEGDDAKITVNFPGVGLKKLV